VTAAVHLPVFRNEHLSVSRLRRYEQCPLAFYYQYVNKPDPALDAVRSEPAEFGTVLHDALERVYRWVLDEEVEGPFPEAQLLEYFRLAWIDSGLVGVGLYQEGRDLLRRYAQDTGRVDHMRTLAIEREFNLLVGPGDCRLVDASEKAGWALDDDHFVINGFIDRVDKPDSNTVEIIDYKSSRLLFSKEELADDLQMSVYALVAQCLYPWATEIRMSFHMLRHGLRQTTVRTAEDLRSAREYVRALGTRSERGPYNPKLNTYCGTCDHRARCDTYKLAVERKLEVVAVSASDLETLAQERERVAKIAKAAYSRKETLDGILKNALDSVFVSFALRNKPLASVGYSIGIAAGARAVAHLMDIAIESELVPRRNTVLIPKVESAFDEAGGPLDPMTDIAMTVMLDDLAWWAALLAQGRAKGELPPANFRIRAATAALHKAS